jgi:hypothetical protein
MIFRSFVAVFCPCALIFCSIVQAASGLSALNNGTERYPVMGELGQSVVTENGKGGRKFDNFTFAQGQHGAAKAETWEATR